MVRDVDLLVVIDSAPAAAGARAALTERIGGFVTDLEARFPGDYDTVLSLHVGFVTGDLGAGAQCGPGDGAALRIESEDCVQTFGEYRWVMAETDAWGQDTHNFTGTTADAVRCAMPTTLEGCAFQQPLRAAVSALDGTVVSNTGFLRSDSVLAVLFVTTQDDCSGVDFTGATPLRCAQDGWTCTPPIDGTPQVHTGCVAGDVSAMIDELRLLRPYQDDAIVVGVIRGDAGPVEVVAGGTLAPSCGAGTDRAATPALKLDAVAAAFPGAIGSVCADLTPVLGGFSWAIEEATQQQEPPYEGPACDGGVGGDDTGGAPADTPMGSAFGCSAGGGAGGGLGVLLLLSLAAATARRGCRRDP